MTPGAVHRIRIVTFSTLYPSESHLTGSVFRQILGRIGRLAWHPT